MSNATKGVNRQHVSWVENAENRKWGNPTVAAVTTHYPACSSVLTRLSMPS
jgi:hypothetical protein